MKIDPRFKNRWFWITMAGLFFSTTQIDPATMTSWSAVKDAVWTVISNPFLLVSFGIAVMGQWNNPTTPGLGD